MLFESSNGKDKVLLQLLKLNPNRVIKTLPWDKVIKLLKYLDKKYYEEGQSYLTDAEYDRFRNAAQALHPNDPYFSRVGHEVIETSQRKNKVKIPYFLPSLSKIYPNTQASSKWTATNKTGSSVLPCIVSDKLDGESLLLVYRQQKLFAYTRGDGEYGRDVSNIVTHISNIPFPDTFSLTKDSEIVVRGELIISRSIFDSRYKNNKTTKSYKNSRAALVGAVNRNAPGDSDILTGATFIAYELIRDKNQTTSYYTPLVQFQRLQEYGFDVVPYKFYSKGVTDTILQERLKDRKLKSKYDLDGLVVIKNKAYTRSQTTSSPDYMVAFKDNDSSEQKVVQVQDVIWRVTRTGVYAPRVMIHPTTLGNSTVTYLTGFNAFFIENGFSYKDRNKYKIKKPIGIGAKIRIVKSGDVIPYILEVVTPAAKAKLPDCDYEYDSNRVTIRHVEIKNESFSDKSSLRHKKALEIFSHFFKTIGAMYVGDSIISRMLETGTNKISVFLKMSKNDFVTKLNLSEKMANKIHDSIHTSLAKTDLPTLANATGILGKGMGDVKVRLLFTHIPDLINMDLSVNNQHDLINRISQIKGFSQESAKMIVSNIPRLKKFAINLNFSLIYDLNVRLQSNRLKSLRVVFSKVRDSDLEQQIKQNGGTVENSVTQQTNHLVVRDLSDTSTKIRKARDTGVIILTLAEFKRKFQL